MTHDVKRIQKRKAAEKRVIQSESEILVRAIDEQTDRSTAEYIRTDTVSQYVGLLADLDGLSENQQRYLGEYVKDGLTGYAAYRAGIPLPTVYGWARNNEVFKAAYDEAKKLSNEGIEKLALDMASGIYKKPIVSAGQYVCDEPIRDTKMLAMLLRGRLPERYGQKVDVTSNGQSLVKLVDRDTWDSI